MRVLVVGAGATGGYFGGRLAQAGRDVTFLVRPGRAVALRADGLRIVSPHGDATLAPRLVTADAIDGPYDAVLLAVKAYGLAGAMADLAPAVGPETMILPLLNGMRHMDLLSARFGSAAVLGGVCKIAGTVDAEGRIVQLAGFHELAYGERDGTPSARTDRLDPVLRGAGFDARLTSGIEREMWEKWVMLAALGGITCLMRGSTGEVVAAPGGADFAGHFLDEVVAVVNAVGTPPGSAFLATTRAFLTEPGAARTSSMYRDLQQGAPIEADQIIGDLLVRGRAAGIDTPLLALAATHLAVYQRRLAGG
ncbi:2-dehydropantoate 2-reductase [Inquilinus ginsengisoli]|uniref:2-dehydropantoate 2-reductase n=1 Tax=Inquilinus ginsengisoli TaxID=363840 RepID=UPI003D23BEC2